MLKSLNSLPPVAHLAIGILLFALVQSADAQCRGGGGGMSGGPMGGGPMGGSFMSGGYMGSGYTAGSYMGGMSRSNGMMGGYQGQQGQYNTGSQNYASSHQAGTSSTTLSLNNPSTVLAHTTDLNLTSKQVQLLEKMQAAGKQRAALVLTQAQRKQLAQIIGIVSKTRTT